MDMRRAAVYCRGENLAFQVGITTAFILNRQLIFSRLYVEEENLDAWEQLMAGYSL